jgi:hypothetical protein
LLRRAATEELSRFDFEQGLATSSGTDKRNRVKPTHSSRQPVHCAAHHAAAPVQITLRRAFNTAMIALLSLISRAAFSERSDECDNCGNFLLGEVRVPASRETILYVNGSRGGFFDLSALAASSVRAHLDMDRRRAYGIVGVEELELVVSERSGESEAESEAGIMSRRGRSISMRWGSSETDRFSGGGGPLIEGAKPEA